MIIQVNGNRWNDFSKRERDFRIEWRDFLSEVMLDFLKAKLFFLKLGFIHKRFFLFERCLLFSSSKWIIFDLLLGKFLFFYKVFFWFADEEKKFNALDRISVAGRIFFFWNILSIRWKGIFDPCCHFFVKVKALKFQLLVEELFSFWKKMFSLFLERLRFS